VGTGGGLGRVGSGHFVQEPVRGRTEALLVLSAVNNIIVSDGVSSREIFDHSCSDWLSSQFSRKTMPVCRIVM
jgi:hypothetical protein